ncbi:MAG: tetratricopeptide repeat protein, partial [Candidatus Aminicenantes bacterium]
ALEKMTDAKEIVKKAIFYETQLHDINMAEQYYKKALKIDPNHPWANSDYAVFLNKQGKKELAKKYYERALELDPTDAITHNNYGVLLNEKGEKEQDKAIFHYHQAIMNKPSYASPYYNLGKLLLEIGKEKAAIHYFRHAVTLNPKHWPSNLPLSILGSKDEETS